MTVLGRAVLAFAAMPAVVGIAVPLWLAGRDREAGAHHPAGLLLALAGLAALLRCVRDFHVTGRGTLAPWSPPRRLVVVGLYRFTRNPMYLAVVALVAGIGAWRSSPAVLAYALVLTLLFHLRVVLSEEPVLARSFPEEWAAYARAVPRWRPRLSPWRQSDPGPRSSA